ncbi:hypothetical protein FRC03_006858 [Tulasnella sp. 419]|nr:hypothetical protein FRC03_006858 [Tulasnella sp. 419]
MDNQAGFAVNDSSPSAATNLNQFQSGLHQSGLRGQSTAQDVRYTWQTVSPIPRPTAPIHFPSQSFLLAKASGASSYEPTSSRPNAQGNTGIVEVAASGSATQHTGSTPVGYPAPSNTQVGDIRPSGTTFLLDDSFSLEMFVRAFGVPPPPNRNGGRVIQSGGSTSNANPSVNTGTLAQPSGSSLYPTVLPPCSDPYHAGGAVPNCSVNPSVNAGTWAQPSGSNLFPTGSLPYTNPCHAGGVVPNCNVNPSVNAGTWAQPSGSNLYPTGLLPYTDPCHAGGVVPNCGVNVGTGNTQQSSQIERGPPQLPSFLNELGDGGRGWQL